MSKKPLNDLSISQFLKTRRIEMAELEALNQKRNDLDNEINEKCGLINSLDGEVKSAMAARGIDRISCGQVVVELENRMGTASVYFRKAHVIKEKK